MESHSFVVREGGRARVLLCQHPSPGIQLPAGTIEPGEAPETAAWREATEETGLAEFANIMPLGFRDLDLGERRVIVRPTFSRPDAGSFDWGKAADRSASTTRCPLAASRMA